MVLASSSWFFQVQASSVCFWMVVVGFTWLLIDLFSFRWFCPAPDDCGWFGQTC